MKDLYQAGFTKHLILEAARNRTILRVRTGWYADNSLNREVLQAARVGGILCGPSAAKFYGLWVPDFDKLHISVPPNSPRFRSPESYLRRLQEFQSLNPDAIQLHWDSERISSRMCAEPLEKALERIIRDQEDWFAFVVVESALNLRKLTQQRFLKLLAGDSFPNGHVLSHAASNSESGIESLLKLALIAAGIPFQQQAFIAGVGRVDFLVSEELVIEVDGVEFHQDQYRDRKRDQQLINLGYGVLRFVYSQVVYERDEVINTIQLELGRRIQAAQPRLRLLV